MRDNSGRHFVILSKLSDIGQPMNLLEIGFTASPQIVRNMAARGMVKVTVEMTNRGREVLERERATRLRRKKAKEMAERNAANLVGKLA